MIRESLGDWIESEPYYRDNIRYYNRSVNSFKKAGLKRIQAKLMSWYMCPKSKRPDNLFRYANKHYHSHSIMKISRVSKILANRISSF